MSMFKDDGKKSMDIVINNYEDKLSKLRSGRANASMLYGVEVDYYGTPTPIDQIAQISVVEGRQLVVKLFDPSVLKEVEHAINSSDLNLLAQNDGTLIRINIPALTEETRKQVAKEVSTLAEDYKIQIRNIRRDLNEMIKVEELPEDQEKRELEEVQKLTDTFIKKIDEIAKEKTKEVMTV